MTMVKLSGVSSWRWKARILSLSSTGTPLNAEWLSLPPEDTGKKEPGLANVGENTSMNSMFVTDTIVVESFVVLKVDTCLVDYS